MSPDAEVGGETQEQGNGQNDIKAHMDSLKSDLAAQNANMIAASQESIMQSVRGMIEAGQLATAATKEEAKVIIDSAADDFREEMEEIGIEPSQMNGILKTIQKFMGKHVPKIKTEIKDEVVKANKFAETKTTINANLIEVYPDLQNQNSTFFKQTQAIYNAMSEQTRTIDPMATAYAANEAARRLGVTPVKLGRASVVNEDLPSGNGKENTKKDNKSSEPAWVKNVAVSLSLNPKVFADKIKEYENRKKQY